MAAALDRRRRLAATGSRLFTGPGRLLGNRFVGRPPLFLLLRRLQRRGPAGRILPLWRPASLLATGFARFLGLAGAFCRLAALIAAGTEDIGGKRGSLLAAGSIMLAEEVDDAARRPPRSQAARRLMADTAIAGENLGRAFAFVDIGLGVRHGREQPGNKPHHWRVASKPGQPGLRVPCRHLTDPSLA